MHRPGTLLRLYTARASAFFSRTHTSPGDVQPVKTTADSEHPKTNAMDANFISRCFFFYLNYLVSLARTRALRHSDLIPLAERDSCKVITTEFEETWQADFKTLNAGRTQGPPKGPSLPWIFAKTNRWILFWSFLTEVVRSAGLLAVPSVLHLFIEKISNPFEEPDEGYLYGLVVVMFACSAIAAIAQDLGYALLYRLGMHMQASIMGGIFRKSLKLSSESQLKANMGYILNMCGQDTQRVFYFVSFINLAWSAPAQTIVIFVLLGRLLGYKATLPAAGILLITLYILRDVNQRVTATEQAKMAIADKRVKLLNESLIGIKVVKTYAWEDSFAAQISRLRKRELKLIFRLAVYRAVLFVTFLVTPMLMSIIIFYTYVGTGNELTPAVVFGALPLINLLRLPLVQFPTMLTTYASARVSLLRISDFHILDEDEPLVDDPSVPKGSIRIKGEYTFPSIVGPPPGATGMPEKVMTEADWATQLAEWLPQGTPSDVIAGYSEKMTETGINKVSQFKALNRNGFIRLGFTEDHRNEITRHWDAKNQDPLSPKKGEAKKPFVLKDINLDIKPGELVEIIGPVGCGKSALLSAILGLMQRKDGEQAHSGSIAYVPQKAWMRNLTFRDNILFGSEYDAEKYEEVVKLCELVEDRKVLMAGDNTEIGEKGINLSGGQKQRISLARAIYRDADIYLLDDPLSAVDQETGKSIFYECIIPKLKERGKTVILVTHQVQFLEPADRIIVMNDGQIVEQGTYHELKDLESFANFAQVSNEKKKEKPDPPQPTTGAKPAAAPMGGDKKQGDGGLIKKEEPPIGGVPWEVTKFYIKSLGGYMFILGLFLFYIVSQGALITADWSLSAWTANDYNLTRAQYMGIYGGLSGFGAVCAFIRIVMYAFGSQRAADSIHKNLLATILAGTMRFFDTTPTGRLVDILAKDQQFVDTYLPLMNDNRLIMGFSIIGSLILVGIVTRWFFLPFAFLLVVYYIYQHIFLPSARSIQRIWLMSVAPVISHLGESISGYESIRAYGAIDAFVKENARLVDTANNSYFHSQLLTRWLDVRLGVLSSLAILAAGITVINLRDTLSAASVGLALTYAVNITGQLGVMVLFSSFAETFMTAVQRMVAVIKMTKQEKYKGEKATPASWPETGTIDFKNVQFRYHEDGPLILKDVSFTVPPRCKVGIVGRTGAGKSTITISLFRLTELSGGSIEIGGEDISKFALLDVRNALAMIPQDPVLFEGTVRFNLDPFNRYPDHALWTALERTRLKDAVTRVDGQLSARVLQGGQNFSVGQRQLFCLARALLRKTKILIMDEATASVDPATDELIQRMIRSEFADCTVLTIAHRLNTIADSDRILVLSDGNLAEYDSPQNLLRNPESLYTQLVSESAGGEQRIAEAISGSVSPTGLTPTGRLRASDFLTLKDKEKEGGSGGDDGEDGEEVSEKVTLVKHKDK